MLAFVDGYLEFFMEVWKNFRYGTSGATRAILDSLGGVEMSNQGVKRHWVKHLLGGGVLRRKIGGCLTSQPKQKIPLVHELVSNARVGLDQPLDQLLRYFRALSTSRLSTRTHKKSLKHKATPFLLLRYTFP